MVEVVYYVASSVDGCIATTDGGVERLSTVEQECEDFGHAEFVASVDAVVMEVGRMTRCSSSVTGPTATPPAGH